MIRKLRKHVKKTITLALALVVGMTTINYSKNVAATETYDDDRFVSGLILDENLVWHCIDTQSAAVYDLICINKTDIVPTTKTSDDGSKYILLTSYVYDYKSTKYGTEMIYNPKTWDLIKVLDSEGNLLYKPKVASNKEKINWKNAQVKGLKRKKTFGMAYFEEDNTNCKYFKGYTFTWNNVKGAKGYLVQRYASAEKKWITIKTIKGNTKKNRKFFYTNILGTQVKLRVKAYKYNANGARIYGKASKVNTFMAATCSTLRNNKLDTIKKSYCDKFASENAFVNQNKERVKAGVSEIAWSNAMYEYECYRCMHTTYSHDNMVEDMSVVLKKNGSPFTAESFGYSENLFYGASGTNAYNGIADENIAKYLIKDWVKSPGHYANMITANFICGAIAIGDIRTSGSEAADIDAEIVSYAGFTSRTLDEDTAFFTGKLDGMKVVKN